VLDLARKKNAVGTAVGITATAVSLGVGAGVVGQTGGPTGGLTTFSRFQPTVGAVSGGGLVIQSLNNLIGTTKRRRR